MSSIWDHANPQLRDLALKTADSLGSSRQAYLAHRLLRSTHPQSYFAHECLPTREHQRVYRQCASYVLRADFGVVSEHDCPALELKVKTSMALLQ